MYVFHHFGPDLPLCYCLNSTKFVQLILRKIIKIIATRCQILRLKCIKSYFGWGSPQTPLGELTALLPLAGFNPCPGNDFFATFAGNWGVFLPPGISLILEHITTKFQRLSPYFRCQAFQWCNFRYRVTSTSVRNPIWRPPK